MPDKPNFINDGPDCYCHECGRRLVYGSCPVCDTDQAERIAGLKDRRTMLQIIIRLGREAQAGPLGEIERAEAHRTTLVAVQVLEQVELELAKALTAMDELQRRADEIYKGDRAEEINRGDIDG